MLYLLLTLLQFCLCRREDSVIVILCRNKDKYDIKATLVNFEERFNSKHKYPYVFLNNEDWDEDFKAEMRLVVSGEVTFGKVEPHTWTMPSTVNRELALQNWVEMDKKGVPHVLKESYHNMCRFFSMNFFKHPLLQKYKYYWRIEPEVRFRCPIDNDPFEYMEKNKLMYGFTITLMDYEESIKTLWDSTKEFIKKNKEMIPKNINTHKFIFENSKYNTCHFWSNFEIASFEFFRSPLYMKYAEHLEATGKYYYERWGDAPVHSLAAVLFLDKSKIHHFSDIGYTHPPYTNCPKNVNGCDCRPIESFELLPGSCYATYKADL
ncbi:alpha 1 [Glugoides intestinalis]